VVDTSAPFLTSLARGVSGVAVTIRLKALAQNIARIMHLAFRTMLRAGGSLEQDGSHRDKNMIQVSCGVTVIPCHHRDPLHAKSSPVIVNGGEGRDQV
jgi:hypothetical protein